jgi:hypothetical protein
LFVINLGIAFGAGVYESRVVFDQWLVPSLDGAGYLWDAETVKEANSGLRFWVFVTTVPLTLLTLANLIGAWRTKGAIRAWWLAAVLFAVADRIFTVAYFISTMIGLMESGIPQAEAVAAALQWKNLNYLRHTLVFAAWIASLKTLTRYILGEDPTATTARSRPTDRSAKEGRDTNINSCLGLLICSR